MNAYRCPAADGGRSCVLPFGHVGLCQDEQGDAWGDPTESPATERRALDPDATASVGGSDDGGWFVYAGSTRLGPFSTRDAATDSAVTHNLIGYGRRATD